MARGVEREAVSKRSVVVHVGGQRYVVRSEAEETYVCALAGFVNDRMEEVRRSSRPASSQNVAVLAALNIADELFREKERRVELKQTIKDKSIAAIAYLDKEVKARLEAP